MGLFLFSHIEKCGGTSIHNYLSKTVSNYLVLRPTPRHGSLFNNDQLFLYRKLFPKIKGFGGHRIHLYENYANVDTIYTVLRDPIERYKSHLKHQLNRNIIKTADEFLDNKLFDNFMCRHICGEPSARKAIEILENKNVIVNILEEDLASLERKNVASKDHKIPYFAISQLQNKNSEDLILYNHFLNHSRKKLNPSISQMPKLKKVEQKLHQRIIQEFIYLLIRPKGDKLKRGR